MGGILALSLGILSDNDGQAINSPAAVDSCEEQLHGLHVQNSAASNTDTSRTQSKRPVYPLNCIPTVFSHRLIPAAAWALSGLCFRHKLSYLSKLSFHGANKTCCRRRPGEGPSWLFPSTLPTAICRRSLLQSQNPRWFCEQK